MNYLANNLAPAMRDWFYAAADGDPAGTDAVMALARRRIETCWDVLDTTLADGRRYLVGGTLSTVDFLAVMLMRCSRNTPRKAMDWPNLAPYIIRLRALPSFLTLCEREGLTDWLNSVA